MTPTPSLMHIDETKRSTRISLNPPGDLRTLAQPFTVGRKQMWPPKVKESSGSSRTCWLSLQDNLVIHLHDVRAILSKWGKGEDQRAQISRPLAAAGWSSGYLKGPGPGLQLIGKVRDPAIACNQLKVRARPGTLLPLALEGPASSPLQITSQTTSASPLNPQTS